MCSTTKIKKDLWNSDEKENNEPQHIQALFKLSLSLTIIINFLNSKRCQFEKNNVKGLILELATHVSYTFRPWSCRLCWHRSVDLLPKRAMPNDKLSVSWRSMVGAHHRLFAMCTYMFTIFTLTLNSQYICTDNTPPKYKSSMHTFQVICIYEYAYLKGFD